MQPKEQEIQGENNMYIKYFVFLMSLWPLMPLISLAYDAETCPQCTLTGAPGKSVPSMKCTDINGKPMSNFWQYQPIPNSWQYNSHFSVSHPTTKGT